MMNGSSFESPKPCSFAHYLKNSIAALYRYVILPQIKVYIYIFFATTVHYNPYNKSTLANSTREQVVSFYFWYFKLPFFSFLRICIYFCHFSNPNNFDKLGCKTQFCTKIVLQFSSFWCESCFTTSQWWHKIYIEKSWSGLCHVLPIWNKIWYQIGYLQLWMEFTTLDGGNSSNT